MNYGLDFLGALTPTEAKKERATASGKRAVAAGQKLAKRAPKLAAAIVAAGQKALKAGGAKSSAPPPAAASTPAKAQPAPVATGPSRSAPQPQRKPVPASSARRVPPPSKIAPTKRRATKVGEDEATEEQADIYTQLSDAATSVAEFVGYFQSLLEQIPSSLPLHQNGLGTISQFENWFAKPLEAALQGDQAALAKVPDINGLLEYFRGSSEATEKRWPWDWASLAETYLKLHPPATPVEEPPPVVTPEATPAPVPTPPPAPSSVPAPPTAPPAPMPSAPAPMPAPSYDGGGYGGGYADEAAEPEDDGQYAEQDSVPAQYQEPYEAEYAEAEQYTDEGEYQEEDPFEEPMDEIGELETLLGHKGGGGKGGGGHHHGGHRHHHGGGWGGGPFYWGYPYWPTTGVEIDDQLTESDLDDIADELAERVARKVSETKPVKVTGLDFLGCDSVGVDLLDWRTPGDYRNAVAQLKVSADNLNLTAALLPAWKPIYDNALSLYEKYKDAGWLNALSLSDSAWYAIADAQKRIDEFAAQMRARGEPVHEPPHAAPPQGGSLGGAADWAKDNWKWLVGGGVAVVALPAILPPIIGAAVASRARR